MYTGLFNEFLKSDDTLRVYDGYKLLFTSCKDRLLPLLEYADTPSLFHRQVVIFDKIMGNAAALLSVMVNCREVYSPIGSRLAADTLEKYDIQYHITEMVPYIQGAGGQDMCPMERLSIGKSPEQFYEAVKGIIGKKQPD